MKSGVKMYPESLYALFFIFRNPLLRQLTEENVTHRLPATLKRSFKDVAKNIITIGSITKAFRDIEELDTTTLAPKVEGRIINTNV